MFSVLKGWFGGEFLFDVLYRKVKIKPNAHLSFDKTSSLNQSKAVF